MGKRILTRLGSRRGFSIGEMLVAVLILVMVSAVVAAGVPVAANAYYKVVDSANAQMLLSTTLTKLRTELSTATDVSCSGTTISYRNAVGSLSELTLEFGVTPVGGTEDQAESGIFVDRLQISSFKKQLLVSLEAASGMYLMYESVSYNKTTGVIAFSKLSVMKDDKELASLGDYKIRVLTNLPSPSPTPTTTPVGGT